MPPVTWQLRAAGPEDCAALALIGAASFLETYAGLVDGPAIVAHCTAHHSAEAYRALFAKGARAWIAAADPGGAPLGYALISPPEIEAAQAGDFELKRIYTLSRWQGSGMGAALMQAAIAASQGHARLLLGVYRGNARAIAFYTRHGFAPIATRQFDVGGTLYDDLVLARSLAA